MNERNNTVMTTVGRGPNRLRSLFVAFSLAFVAAPVFAQIFPITAGTINTCTGAMVDSGGEGGPGYSNNENIIATICPDIPGESISLNWVTFNLSQAGAAPVDRMIVYDGSSTTDAIIGTYTGSQLQRQILFASP